LARAALSQRAIEVLDQVVNVFEADGQAQLQLVMICAPAAARPAFRMGVWGRNDRKRREDGADDHISEKGEQSL